LSQSLSADASVQFNAWGQPVGPAVPGWTPRERPRREVLQGSLCRLEPLDLARHVEPLFAAICQDASRWTYLPLAMPAAPSGLAAYLEAANAGPAPRFQTFVIRSVDGAETLGTASFMRIDPDHGSIEVGFVVYGAALAQSPAATEAQYLMARHVFEDLGYRRHEWKCNALNAASRQAAVRLGFRFEGVFRNAMVAQGKSRDTAWFAMTDADWALVKPRQEAWLAPENFDAHRRQRLRLSALISDLWDGTQPVG
jgi:RimJ/RimL family protein N-acetyltransferase